MLGRKTWILYLIIAIAVLHQILQQGFGLSLPFVSSYLDDFLCTPIFLSIWLWERKHFWGWEKLSVIDILACTLVVFVLFELALPRYSIRYVSDYWDGLAYLCGSAVFWWLQKPN